VIKIVHVVGARPNFMKAAPVYFALRGLPQVRQLLVHTGQHYDRRMSDVFFEELGMPEPDFNLAVGSGSHAAQTAEIMMRFEKVLLAEKPNTVVVYGDVNSTIAAALVAAKLGIKVAHVEAGLRSRDLTMPEEINRILTDRISNFLFTPSADGDDNLRAEGVPGDRIFMVGNCMIDTLVRLLAKARRPDTPQLAERYALVTLHRPANVDEPEMLEHILATLSDISRDLQVLFPIHPRTRARLQGTHWETELAGRDGSAMLFTEPLGYLEFLWLQQHAAVVLTDSGGIQEETTYLRTPCITLRENTERPITYEIGTNVLCGRDMDSVRREVARIVRGEKRQSFIPPLWDGRAGERVAKILVEQLS
jgi:UDP-N-acetylglucosamine 2-epimerase (non-hydrolysing)